MNAESSRFIDEEITVGYKVEPLLEKKPRCPDHFTWNGLTFAIKTQILEWVDFNRRGRMARNMSDAHAAIATTKGSWGVGRYYFRVETTNGRIYDLYYDRAPKGIRKRKGQWFLFREFSEKNLI